MQLNEDIRRKLTEAVIAESAQLDGIRPEEMLHSVVDYLEGAEPRKECTTQKLMGHRGVEINEEIVRKIAIAVIKEAEQLDGVDPVEMLQKVIGALQGESVTEVKPVSAQSELFTNRGVDLDDAICKQISEAVIKEAAQLEGVIPEEAIEKVLSALRAQPAREMAAVATVRETAVSAPASDRPASMVGVQRINPVKTSYKGYPVAEKGTDPKEVVIGVGPGFTAGVDVDAVVETKRGHHLGRVLWTGSAAPNTGVPGIIGGYGKERVIHSPAAGILHNQRKITDIVKKGDIIATVETAEGPVSVPATLDGLLRGLIRDGYPVTKGFKIADIDPRTEEYQNCFTISDKARCIAGGVVEAILQLKGERHL